LNQTVRYRNIEERVVEDEDVEAYQELNGTTAATPYIDFHSF
jgi:hypothetical protein